MMTIGRAGIGLHGVVVAGLGAIKCIRILKLYTQRIQELAGLSVVLVLSISIGIFEVPVQMCVCSPALLRAALFACSLQIFVQLKSRISSQLRLGLHLRFTDPLVHIHLPLFLFLLLICFTSTLFGSFLLPLLLLLLLMLNAIQGRDLRDLRGLRGLAWRRLHHRNGLVAVFFECDHLFLGERRAARQRSHRLRIKGYLRYQRRRRCRCLGVRMRYFYVSQQKSSNSRFRFGSGCGGRSQSWRAYIKHLVHVRLVLRQRVLDLALGPGGPRFVSGFLPFKEMRVVFEFCIFVLDHCAQTLVHAHRLCAGAAVR
eukprot:Colp12_sorted_trinity150504_noHs@10248